MNLVKTDRKQNGSNIYDVYHKEKIIGSVYKEYNKSGGAAYAKYVGHWEGYYNWRLDLDFVPVEKREYPDADELYKEFDSLKELKIFLKDF